MITHRVSISKFLSCNLFKDFILNDFWIIFISKILFVSKNVVNYLTSLGRFVSW